MGGLEGTAAAFQRGWDTVARRKEEHRARQEALQDEERRLQVQDIFDQRTAMRQRAASLGLKPGDTEYDETVKGIAGLDAKLDDLYHPKNNPGALQKDWHFLTGLITRHKKQTEAVEPPTPEGQTTPDITIKPPADTETVRLAADTGAPAVSAAQDLYAQAAAPAAAAPTTGGLPPGLVTTPGAAPNLDAIVNFASKTYGVNPALINAIMQRESSKDPNALGPETPHGRAGGLMQLMPKTAETYGVQNVFDPAQNVMGAARYLRSLLDIHGGNVTEAVKDYYGRGTPRGPDGQPLAGQPTTAGYAERVLGKFNSLAGGQQAGIVGPASWKLGNDIMLSLTGQGGAPGSPSQPLLIAPTMVTPAQSGAAPAPASVGAATKGTTPFEAVKWGTMPGNDVLQQILSENPGLGKTFNKSNTTVVFAGPERSQRGLQEGQLEYWPSTEEGAPDFKHPIPGKNVLEVYSDDLKKDPAKLKEALYGDLMHGMSSDPYWSKLREDFMANFTPQELQRQAQKKTWWEDVNKSKTPGDPTYDAYIRGWLVNQGEPQKGQAESGNTMYSPKQLEVLQKMQDYLKTGKTEPGAGAQDVTLPAYPVTIPGTKAPAVTTPALMTRAQRAQWAQQDKYREQAEAFMRGMPLTPEETAQSDAAKKMAEIQATMGIAQKLMGPNWSEADQEEFKQSLIDTSLAASTKEKYTGTVVPIKSPDGTIRYYQLSTSGAPPREIKEFGGKEMLPKPGTGAGKGGGTDFWKTVEAKYGQNGRTPTAEEIESEYARWKDLGAHGTRTVSKTDMFGNVTTYREPVFAPGTMIPAGTITGDSGGVADDTSSEGPVTWEGGGGVPSTPAAPAAPVGGVGAAPGEAGVEAPPNPVPLPPTVQGAKLPDDLPMPTEQAPIAPSRDPRKAANLIAWLNSKQAGYGDMIKGIADYKTALPTARSSQKTAILGLVYEINPNYDATKFTAVQKARASFTAGGNDALSMASLGMAIGHLDTLREAYKGLDNGDYWRLNAGKNRWRTETGDNAAIAATLGSAQAVAGELASVFKRHGAPAQAEIEEWNSRFDVNMSPAAFNSSVDTMTNLMASRMMVEAQTWMNTFGSLNGFPQLSRNNVRILSGINAEGAREMLQINQQATQATGYSTAIGQPPASQARPAPKAAPAPGGTGDFIYAQDKNGNWYRAPRGQALPPGLTIVNPPAQ